MNDFLSKDYSIPTESNYMRFIQGENMFRVLSSAIVGMEYWITDPENPKKRVPVRKHMGVNIPMDVLEENPKSGNVDMPKHFWAFVVYNYQDKRVQILEITQKGIQKGIIALTKSVKWGSPQEYDINVTRDGEGLDTEYSVMPQPKEKLDEGILQLYKDMNINLEALFDGKDPFKSEGMSDTELDEIDKAITKGE